MSRSKASSARIERGVKVTSLTQEKAAGAGARVSPRGRNGKNSALVEASLNGDLGRVTELLERRADVNWTNSRGETALASAAAWNRGKVLELLLKHGADPNVADHSGGTALMLAAQHADEAAVKSLIEYGADSNASDAFGNSALMHALWRRDGRSIPPVVRALLASRPRLDVVNRAGESAYTIAMGRGLKGVARALRANGESKHARQTRRRTGNAPGFNPRTSVKAK